MTISFLFSFNKSANTPRRNNEDEDIVYPNSYPIKDGSVSYPLENPPQPNLPRSLTMDVTTSGYDPATKTITQEITPGNKLVALFTLNPVNFDRTQCNARVSQTSPEYIDNIQRKPFILGEQNFVTLEFDVGNYTVVIDCFYQETFSEMIKVKAIKASPSACDNVSIAGNFSFKDLESTKSGIIGKWKGCTKDINGFAYRVQFEFNSEDYIAKNIEVVENPGSSRTENAAYFNQEQMANLYKFESSSAEGISGGIKLFAINPNYGAWRKIKLSEDGNKLYFEIGDLENTRTKVYLLEKVND